MSVVDRANRHVSEYATKEFKKAYERVQREQKGQGCGCPACKRQAVERINSISHFIAGGQDLPEYQVDHNGDIGLEWGSNSSNR